MNMFSSIIFADSYDHPATELIEKRTLASIPFGGRFRLIDFVLSSLTNAGVTNIAVMPKKNYASLEDHLGGGKYWDLDHRNSGLKILSPFFKTANNNEVFLARGKLDALRSVQPHIRSLKEEYIVLTNGNLVANIDFEKVFKAHIESGADVTAVYANTDTYAPRALELSLEGTKVKGITYVSADDSGKRNISLNVYVMKRDLLLDIIREADAHDHYSFEKYALINKVDTLNIAGFEHTEFAKIVYSVQDYYNTSMQMLDSDVRSAIFTEKRPVMTRVKDSVPVLYQYNAKISNSLIADGCKIDGTVKNSIIFRNVTIETGAVVENCIIMQNTVVGKESSLSNVILDKNIKISDKKELCGDAQYPFILKKGSEI